MSRTGYLDEPAPIGFAHRGGARTGTNLGIENSLEAMTDAVARGFTYLETDVRCSADGTVLLVHDETLERLTGTPAAVADLTDRQLADERLDDRAALPRLVDVLQALPEARLNIDIKSDDAIEAACEVIVTENAVDRVCLASFSYRRLRRIRRLLPGVVTGASTLEVALVMLLPVGLLTRLGLPHARCLQVPVATRGLPITTARFVARARRLGLPVHVWTVDEAEEMHRLLDLGVDGIITDRTDVLADVLRARAVWPPENRKDTP
ncbi:glycerophosphodiester phosphodiesterase family protein [Aeromicrobium sp. CF3.5]|uniref:glycerophosphodiester phosphodiesterase family protein n=1 Tax=Aeromicrobium sp. CF3.5 TaxID=3373078 RepID=UPI003EE81838